MFSQFQDLSDISRKIGLNVRGLFEPSTFGIYIKEGYNIKPGDELLLLSTRFHEYVHFLQSIMSTYGIESQYIADMRASLFLKMLKWFRESYPSKRIPVPMKCWLEREGDETPEIALFKRELSFLDSYEKTFHGFPLLPFGNSPNTDIVPLIGIEYRGSLFALPLGGIVIAENWARLCQIKFLIATCSAMGRDYKEFKSLFKKIEIGPDDEAPSSTLKRYALYLSLSDFIRDSLSVKEWKFLFCFMADKSLMLPLRVWTDSIGGALVGDSTPMHILPGYRYRQLLNAIRKDLDALRPLVEAQDYSELDSKISTMLGWPTTAEVLSATLLDVSNLAMPVLQRLYRLGFEFRQSYPDAIVDPLSKFELLNEALPAPVFYQQEGWVGFSDFYSPSERIDLAYIFNMTKLSRALLYGEPCPCFYKDCPCESSCNTLDAIRGPRGSDCELEKWAERYLAFSLCKMQPIG